MDVTIFKAYDIRGVYPEQLNEEDAWKIGSAAARFLPSLMHGYDRGGAHSRSICVGRDMRTHSKGLSDALISGITAAGIDAIDIGMVDSPQIYYAINELGTCGGIQVTASHNPAKYNGFKISGPGAKPIGEDTGLKDIRHIATSLIHTRGRTTGAATEKDLTAGYRRHVLKFLNPKIRKLKVAIDALNGMAGKMVPAVFGKLPIEIVRLNFEHDGSFKHEPNPLIGENLVDVKAAVRQNKCDFGVCFDGDADRLMMVDEKSETVGCDLMTALMAGYFLKKHPRATIVYDLRSSRVVAEEIIRLGGTPRRERVGHAFMKKAMCDSHAIFGGELSGHFYYRDNFNGDSGLITLVHILNIVSDAKVPVSRLMKPFRKYYASGEVNFEVKDKEQKMAELERRFRDGQADHLDGVTVGFKDWWFNCRPSNTEPLLRLNVEAKTEELLAEKLVEIESVLGKPVGHAGAVVEKEVAGGKKRKRVKKAAAKKRSMVKKEKKPKTMTTRKKSKVKTTKKQVKKKKQTKKQRTKKKGTTKKGKKKS